MAACPEVEIGPVIWIAPVIGTSVRRPKERSPVTPMVPLLKIVPVIGASIETPAESLPSAKMGPELVMWPTKGAVPVTRTPKRLEPWARGASTTPSLLLSGGSKSSMLDTLPELVKLPVTPPWIRTAVDPFTLLNWIVPSLVTALLLFSVTAGLVAAVGWTVPPDATSTLSGAPLVAVAVATGVACVAVMLAAWADPKAATKHNGPSATAANKDERMDNP